MTQWDQDEITLLLPAWAESKKPVRESHRSVYSCFQRLSEGGDSGR